MAATAPRMKAIGQALMAGRGTLPANFGGLATHPMLSISIHTRVAMALDIVFLKTDKPDLGGSLLTIALAMLVGVASVLLPPLWRTASPQLGREETQR